MEEELARREARVEPAVIKKGLGLSIHTWGGTPHASDCDVTIQPDGSVEVKLGSQDLGMGTRTVLNIVAAETLGLPLEAVKVIIGDNRFPPSGPPGRFDKVGGISSSSRRASLDALNQFSKRSRLRLKLSRKNLRLLAERFE